ncbi:transcriptional regulator, CdaR family protein [Rhodococcus ruber BKS 20-38]|uniref:Transcriptional regulator, CdaR family protein n=1 Tax=Rhodococcus ruber BKS 20-38 TaxID=1278076 RepID=M2YRV3_9NOCA|nr:GAF domain-containing protein [Rhodococcus ruber]EME51528.1 transcriptional regulator, CdaR family protein [Rhodococcus ruber BKS 20-38]
MDPDLLHLLELLAGDATSAELAQAEIGRPDLAEAIELALKVHAVLGRHRTREAELTALFDTASDLAALRDPDEVLQSIVRRARTLLSVDVAYLSLNNPQAQCTYMRVTEGSISPVFQNVTLDMGEGIGGMVAQNRQPYATADWFHDTRLQRSPKLDEAMRSEGLHSVLGVPLATGDTVIGVLFVGARTERLFTPHDTALLSSLAHHAAIALDNARLIETTRAHSEAIARAGEAHDRLMDLVLRGSRLSEVAAAVTESLSGQIAIFDLTGTELTRTGPLPQAPPMDVLSACRTSGRAQSLDGAWACAIQAGHELLGSLVLAGPPELNDTDRRLFERAAVVTALLLMLQRSVAKAEDEVRGELLSDLITAPGRNPAALNARAARLGLDLAVPHVVLIAQTADVSRRRLASACTTHAALCGIHAEEVVFLVPGTDADGCARRMSAMLSASVQGPVTVGAAGPARGPEEIATAHAEASRCLHAMVALDLIGKGGSMARLGFLGVLLGDRTDLPGFVKIILGPVLDYDRRRDTDLVHTLESYFGCGGNLKLTGQRLHVHPNTVAQRLERISSLLGGDWSTPERALEIQMALKVLATGVLSRG